MRPKIFLLWLMVIAGVSGVHAATNILETKNAATAGLLTFRQLVNAANYRGLGFTISNEVQNATLGEPMWVYTVKLNELQNFRTNSKPEKLLKDYEKVLYPLMVNQAVRSSLAVGKPKRRWTATSFGRPGLIQILTEARKASSYTNQIPIASHFAVEIPALNAYFIGFRAENKLMLVPVIADPEMGILLNRPKPAMDVFRALVPAAKNHGGYPG
jgi:hypothetical protein